MYNLSFEIITSIICCVILTISNGDNEIRTRDLLLARQALSQLSYTPICLMHISYLILTFNGLEWTRTIDLTLMRRAL